jgi:hypothetical protein
MASKYGISVGGGVTKKMMSPVQVRVILLLATLTYPNGEALRGVYKNGNFVDVA